MWVREIHKDRKTIIILFFNQIPYFQVEFSVKSRSSIKRSMRDHENSEGNLFRVENINDVENNPSRGIRG